MKSSGLRIVIVLAAIIFFSCSKENREASETGSQVPEKRVSVPLFNADSAYSFVVKQVMMGPRVPNSEAHRNAGDYFVSKLTEYGAEVIVQEFDAMTFDDNRIFLRNIIAKFFPEKKKRILLAAHWDTRPFADKDEDLTRQDQPIDGANDGASGVAVLLEIARAINESPNDPEVGIDIILFDGEDWGAPSSSMAGSPSGDYESWWCLGSQYWSNNKHEANYSAFYGILLDMVGAKDAQFAIEGLSNEYAGKVVKKIWDWGNALGYGQQFIYDKKPGIEDDHKYINQIAKIPMVDIVHYDQENGFFGDFHHSHKDNLELIDKYTLRTVGETVLYVIYHE